MKRQQYIQPRIISVAFVTEEGFTASVTRMADQMVLFDFHSDNVFEHGFRNDQFGDLGGDNNSDYNFFGD